MNFRAFGKAGIKVSEMGLGCSHLGGGVFGDYKLQSLHLLDRAFELGINFFDTADSYGYGYSEELIGRAFRKRRDRVFIATKAGMLPSSLARYAREFLPIFRSIRSILKPMRRSLKAVTHRRQDFSTRHITCAVERSLTRLRTDYLDLLQLHSPPVDFPGRDDVFDSLARLSSQGKVRYWGVSSRTIRDAFFWLNVPRIASIQVPFNLLEHEGGRDLFSKAAAHGVAIIARVPFARGLLISGGTIHRGGGKPIMPVEEARSSISRLTCLAQSRGRSLANAAMQFILSHPEISTVIPGTRSVDHLEQNVRSLDGPPFTGAEIQAMVGKGDGVEPSAQGV
jgi:aryl-alcohol dehydrogenase-like predicted oxidoreductase